MNNKIIGLFILSLAVIGCKNDKLDRDLDSQLLELISDASNGQGTSSFVLPDESQLSQIPQDPLNPLTPAKVALGQLLFHETGLGVDAVNPAGANKFSCASCHQASADFHAGRRQGIGEGGIGFGNAGEARVFDPTYNSADVDVQPLRSPTVLNGAYQKVMLWNGQFGATGANVGTEYLWTNESSPIFNNNLGFEGLEVQAIAGLKVHRLNVDTAYLFQHEEYRTLFNQAFGNLPESERYTKLTVALAIAAYERTILSNQAPFQKWLKGETFAMDEQMIEGAIVFFGKGDCASCHNGPSLALEEFHALGMEDLVGPDILIKDELAHAKAGFGRGSYTGQTEDDFKFKTPQLYNLKYVNALGHGASFPDLRSVIEYKNNGVPENGRVPADKISDKFAPLNLTDKELDDLIYFLEEGLFDPFIQRYEPNSLPTGLCFPNNDEQSRLDRGC